MHARLPLALSSTSSSCIAHCQRLLLPRCPCVVTHQLRSFAMSAKVLSSSENLPVASTAQEAGAMEPPTKQPRLEQPSSFKIKLLNEHAQPPKRGSALAAGYDLFSAEDTEVPAKGKKLVSTGIAIHTPPGTYGRVAPRSGLACKNFIDVGAGVIDEDYRGEVKVLLFNFGEEAFKVEKGMRVAQLVLERIITPPVEVVEDLDATDRGAGGFGSTGFVGNPSS